MDDAFTRASAQTRLKRTAKEVESDAQKRVQSRLFADVERVCQQHQQEQPGGWLAELQCGVDPRTVTSRVRIIVDGIEARGATEMPTEEEWFEIADLIKSDPRYNKEPVDLDLSFKAASDLSKLLYKSQSSMSLDAEVHASVTPLTREEMDEFDAWFQEKYAAKQ